MALLTHALRCVFMPLSASGVRGACCARSASAPRELLERAGVQRRREAERASKQSADCEAAERKQSLAQCPPPASSANTPVAPCLLAVHSGQCRVFRTVHCALCTVACPECRVCRTAHCELVFRVESCSWAGVMRCVGSRRRCRRAWRSRSSPRTRSTATR